MIEKKINNINIEKLKTDFDEKKYKHFNLFPKPYPLIYIEWKRGSGKTNLIYNILYRCATKKTEIHYFWWTCMNDNTFLEMEKKFKKYKFNFFSYTDIYDNMNDDDYESHNNIIEKLYYNAKSYIENNYDNLKKLKYDFPSFIFVFDDFWKYMK